MKKILEILPRTSQILDILQSFVINVRIFFTVVEHFITYHFNYFFKHDSKNFYEIRLRTPLRTFEAENAQKIRTSRLGRKNGVLIKKISVKEKKLSAI